MMGRLLLLGRLAARDIRRHPAEAVMVLLVIAAATTTLTLAFALNGVTNNPYQQTRSATAGPDVIAVAPGAQTSSMVTSLARAPGVAAHSGPYPYVYSSIRFRGHSFDVVAEGRDQAPAAVDQPKLTQGAWVRPGGVVIERGFADALGVKADDQVSIGGRSFRVAGVAVTAAVPAYPSSLCHLACGMAVPANMGLIWLTRSAAQHLAGPGASLSYLLNLKLAHPGDAPAFIASHQIGPPAPVILYTWQSIRGADDGLIQVEQAILQFGGWLLGLLALAGLGILVGRRMTEQTRRIGLLKAVGATTTMVAVVLLFEQLALAAGAAAIGLLVGWMIAPLITSTGAGLLGSAGAPSISAAIVLVIAAVAIVVAAVSSLVPALRAGRTSTVSALNDAPRVPPRRPWITAISARLPVPLLLALRLASRRPRRALLNALSITVTVTGIVAILAVYAHNSSGNLGIHNLKADRLDELMAIITVMLAILAVVNTIFIAWATAADARFSSALERALGATARQVTTGLSMAQLLPALPAAAVGVPLGFEVYNLISAEPLTIPPLWQLITVFAGSLVAVTLLTAIPARLGARRAPAQILQSE